jgi:VanZ family protein
MAFIFFLSSRSTIGIGQTQTERFLILKSFHLIEYIVLSILYVLSFNNQKTTLISAYCFALTDELHQVFVSGREGKFVDTLIDLLGIVIGLLIVRLYRQFDKSKNLRNINV